MRETIHPGRWPATLPRRANSSSAFGLSGDVAMKAGPFLQALFIPRLLLTRTPRCSKSIPPVVQPPMAVLSALDAKMTFGRQRAFFRHKELPRTSRPRRRRSSRSRSLKIWPQLQSSSNGNWSPAWSTGAGLAMATNGPSSKYAPAGSPANFPRRWRPALPPIKVKKRLPAF